MKIKHFIIAGITAMVSSMSILPNIDNTQDLVNSVKANENLNQVSISIHNDYSTLSSYSRNKRTPEGSKESSIGIVPYTTSWLKMFAPVEFIKTKSKLFSDFIVLHEMAHSELNYDLYNNPLKSVNVKIEGATQDLNNGLNKVMLMEEFSRGVNKSFLAANYHENFADTYASILIIRNKHGEYSDSEIFQTIKARHAQAKNQEELLWGAAGSLEHRTQHSLQKILDTDFDKIRSLSPEEAKSLAIQISSNSVMEQYPQKFKNTLIHYKDNLPNDSMTVIEQFKTDNSYLTAVSPNKEPETPNAYAHLKNLTIDSNLNDKIISISKKAETISSLPIKPKL